MRDINDGSSQPRVTGQLITDFEVVHRCLETERDVQVKGEEL